MTEIRSLIDDRVQDKVICNKEIMFKLRPEKVFEALGDVSLKVKRVLIYGYYSRPVAVIEGYKVEDVSEPPLAEIFYYTDITVVSVIVNDYQSNSAHYVLSG